MSGSKSGYHSPSKTFFVVTRILKLYIFYNLELLALFFNKKPFFSHFILMKKMQFKTFYLNKTCKQTKNINKVKLNISFPNNLTRDFHNIVFTQENLLAKLKRKKILNFFNTKVCTKLLRFQK